MIFNTIGQDDQLLGGFNVQEYPMQSSWLDYATRNMDTGEIAVRFKDGYIYEGYLSDSDWQGLITTTSPGRFWWSLMRQGKVRYKGQ